MTDHPHGGHPPERIVVQWAARGLLDALSRALEELTSARSTAEGEAIRARGEFGRLAGTTARYLSVLGLADDALGFDAQASLAELAFDLSGAASIIEMAAVAHHKFLTGEGPLLSGEDVPATFAGIQVRSLEQVRTMLASVEDPLAYSRPHEAPG